MDFFLVTSFFLLLLWALRYLGIQKYFSTAILALPLLLYVAGIFGFLEVGVLTICAAVLVLAMLGIRGKITPRSQVFKLSKFVSPSNFYLIIFAVTSYFFTRALQFHTWDEFSHWGFVAKATNVFNALSPLNPAQIQFRSYPPAVTLFEYLVTKLGLNWSEANVFWAYQILIISMVYPFIAKVQWKNKFQIALATMVAFLTPLVFFNSYTEIYVDSILGITFGFAIASIYVSKVGTWSASIQLAITLAFLTLIKDSGTFFAALAFVFYLVRFIQAQINETERKSILRTVGMALIPASSVALAYLSWSWLLAANKVEKIFNQPIDFSKVFANDSASPAYWQYVRSAFGTAISTVSLNGFMTLTLCFVILISFVFIFEKSAAAILNKKFSLVPGVFFIVGGVIYSIGMLALYLFRFVEYEATRLASYSRYIGTYWAGVVFAITALSIWLLGEKPSFEPRAKNRSSGLNKATVFSSSWVLMLLIMVGATPAFGNLSTAAADSQAVRAPLEPLVEKAHSAGVTKGSKVWIISQYSNGFEYWILRYGLLEAKVNDGGWSLGTRNGDQDVWTSAKTAQEWQQDLQSYDFVVFYNVTQQFYNEFNSVFVTPSELNVNTVFKVRHDTSGAKLVLAK